MTDWVEKQEQVLQNNSLIVEFTLSSKFEEAYLEWHREEHPEEWGND